MLLFEDKGFKPTIYDVNTTCSIGSQEEIKISDVLRNGCKIE